MEFIHVLEESKISAVRLVLREILPDADTTRMLAQDMVDLIAENVSGWNVEQLRELTAVRTRASVSFEIGLKYFGNWMPKLFLSAKKAFLTTCCIRVFLNRNVLCDMSCKIPLE